MHSNRSTSVATNHVGKAVFEVGDAKKAVTVEFDTIMELREERLDSVHIALPAVYWDVVFFAMVVLVLAASAVERTPLFIE